MTSSLIRPAARLIKTIGQDLIKDVYAAIVELVKNAYDADSPDATVRFDYNEEEGILIIAIEDHGHGMSQDVVINKWLVPATDDKLVRKRSNNKRVLQGRKGIGRFAAAILGERISLETTSNGITTFLTLDMEKLDKVKYLDQMEIEVISKTTNKGDGTTLRVEKKNITPEDVRSIWTTRQLRKLFVELRSLTAPEEVYKIAGSQGFDIFHDPFEMKLHFGNFPVDEYDNKVIDIQPFPVIDLYDYKISGRIDGRGNANITYENKNIPSLSPESFYIKIPLSQQEGYYYPGEIFLDIRVYDRDSEGIDNIIKRGLKDPDTGCYVGKMEARRILDEYYGIGIYREQFRVRPYGEQTFDWVDLDKKRVQNPSFKIGHNQVIGFVYIRPEEVSGLQEKSARDGLVENGSYYGLVAIVSQVIKELEVRRYRYREKALRGGRSRTIEEEIDLLFDFNSTKNKISAELNEIGVSPDQRKSINAAVNKVLDRESKKKSGYARRIRDTIAIYQGQATLGNITHVLLHEGRKHIKYISETVPRINKWAISLSSNSDPELFDRLEDRSAKVLTHAKGLSFLFKKIEPLARVRRSPKKKLNIKKEIENSFAIFSSELDSKSIQYDIVMENDDLNIIANEIDFLTIFSNLIENSVFWLSGTEEKKIKVISFFESDCLIIEYSDTGPGFQGGNLEAMFEPGYSMKPNGTGLGLALVGEAIGRVGGGIKAKQMDAGAMFELTFKGVGND